MTRDPLDLEARRAERRPPLELGTMTVALAAALARVSRAEVAHDRAHDAYIRRPGDATGERWLDARDELSAAGLAGAGHGGDAGPALAEGGTAMTKRTAAFTCHLCRKPGSAPFESGQHLLLLRSACFGPRFAKGDAERKKAETRERGAA